MNRYLYIGIRWLINIMKNVKLVQVVALVNWVEESFEVTKWFKATKGSEEIFKEMHWIFMKIYSNFLPDKSLDDLKKGNFLITPYDTTQDVKTNEVAKIVSRVHYERLEGKCLDVARLMYFAPTKRVLVRDITVEKLNKIA